MFLECGWYVFGIFLLCFGYVFGLLPVCCWYAVGMLLVCLWYVFGMFSGKGTKERREATIELAAPALANVRKDFLTDQMRVLVAQQLRGFLHVGVNCSLDSHHVGCWLLLVVGGWLLVVACCWLVVGGWYVFDMYLACFWYVFWYVLVCF